MIVASEISIHVIYTMMRTESIVFPSSGPQGYTQNVEFSHRAQVKLISETPLRNDKEKEMERRNFCPTNRESSWVFCWKDPWSGENASLVGDGG